MLSKTITARFTAACLFVCCFLILGHSAPAQRDEVPTDEAIIAKGEHLFSEWSCNTCHKVDQRLVGPALKGVYDRRSLEWIYAFVQNSQRVIDSGDAQAVAVYNEYKQYMPSHDLPDEDILAILAYVRNYEENPPVAAPPTDNMAGQVLQYLKAEFLLAT